MNIVTINCGSTSFKYKFFVINNLKIVELFSGIVENIGSGSTSIKEIYNGKRINIKKDFSNLKEAALFSIVNLFDLLIKDEYIQSHENVDYFVYKVAHGGNKYYEPIIIDKNNINDIAKYNQFAPSHNPNFIEITKLFLKKFPTIKNYYYFETIFHKNLEKFKKIYALPYEWIEKYEILKYGFHSAAHSYSLLKANEFIGHNKFKMISCHLGGGSSIAAIKNGESFEISSSFTPQSGTVMATRPGDFDPYIIIYLLKSNIFTLDELENKLNNDSGLKGISGLSSNVVEIVQKAQSGNKKANLAIDVFCYSICKYIFSYIGLLKGVDLITFSGGIGENSQLIRKKIIKNLDFFKIYLDDKKNNSNNFIISNKKSKTVILKINTNEEFIILKSIFNI